MFSTSYLYVEAILDEKRKAVAAERLVTSPSTSLTSQIAKGAKSLWSLLGGPADRPGTPTLVDYPFRG